MTKIYTFEEAKGESFKGLPLGSAFGNLCWAMIKTNAYKLSYARNNLNLKKYNKRVMWEIIKQHFVEVYS